MAAAVPTLGTVPTLSLPGTPAREAVALGAKRTTFTYKQVAGLRPGAHSQRLPGIGVKGPESL